MNIIIVGIGSVGFTATEVLSHYHDVMIIDHDRNVIEKAKNLLNVSVLYEDGANPKVLEGAITRHKADVVISTTGRDDDNLLICMLSKIINPGIKTIARIRDPDYLINTSDKTVDQIISPEIMTANKMAELALLENAIDYESIESMDLGLAVFEVTEAHTKMIGQMIINLEMPDDCSVMAIYRDDDVIMNPEMVQIRVGDRIRVLGSPDGIRSFNMMMGVQRDATEFIIIGGGVAGSRTAKLLESKKRYVKLFEMDPKKCSKLAKDLNTSIIVNGSGVDPHLLRSENVGRADVMIAITDTDETNLLACLMGMKLGTTKVISRYSMVEYEDIFDFTGIRSTVGNHRVVANEVTKTLIEDEKAILRMKRDGELFFSVQVDPRSKVSNERLGDINFPEGCRVGCIIRDKEKIYPRMDTVFKADDRVILFTYNSSKSKLEKLFGTRIDIEV
ncbi:MAG: Trk system potassium transporter TrkA [Candidatus Methanomethylophilaceae archaeon]|nr:Trk system potassium transporter TrkA [Candidatus Methanomethylophilaceae archaeon]